jgi:hypothetical protein
VVATLGGGWDTPLGGVAHLMPTTSILNEIKSCCWGHFYKKSRREKRGDKGFEEGERERRWIEKRKNEKNVYGEKEDGNLWEIDKI